MCMSSLDKARMFIYLFLGKNRYCDNLVILIPIIPVKEKVITDIGKKS